MLDQCTSAIVVIVTCMCSVDELSAKRAMVPVSDAPLVIIEANKKS